MSRQHALPVQAPPEELPPDYDEYLAEKAVIALVEKHGYVGAALILSESLERNRPKETEQ